ncbi:MAG: OmpA family protein [Psychrilyobacter sp.]|nr:OmpA family protein [Psychrilyobacter sp.]
MKKVLFCTFAILYFSSCYSVEKSINPLKTKIQVLEEKYEANIILLEEIKKNNVEMKYLIKTTEKDLDIVVEEKKLKKVLQGTNTTIRRDRNKFYLVLQGDTTFRGGSLNKNILKTLDSIAKSIKLYPETKVKIIGHTDNIGSESHNKKLSENRANIIKNYLVKSGVVKKSVETVGMGSLEPIDDNELKDGRTINRRVEIIIKY